MSIFPMTPYISLIYPYKIRVVTSDSQGVEMIPPHRLLADERTETWVGAVGNSFSTHDLLGVSINAPKSTENHVIFLWKNSWMS